MGPNETYFILKMNEFLWTQLLETECHRVQ